MAAMQTTRFDYIELEMRLAAGRRGGSPTSASRLRLGCDSEALTSKSKEICI